MKSQHLFPISHFCRQSCRECLSRAQASMTDGSRGQQPQVGIPPVYRPAIDSYRQIQVRWNRLCCKLQARHPESTSAPPQLAGIDTRVDSNPMMSPTCECRPNLWWWVMVTRIACARRQERTSVTRRCLVESLISASTFDSSTHLFRPLHCNCLI